MGLNLTLTDEELPVSPAFIEFLHVTLKGGEYHVGDWFGQEGEGLATNEGRYTDIQKKAHEVVSHPQGKALVLHAYRYFKEMLTGRIDTLRNISRFQFYFVVGIPRTGGTYLTKQLFRASGIDYTKVQNALAHDGFPHLAHLSFKKIGNIHTNGLLQMAEYLTMVEVYFGQHARLAHRGGVVVPKKFTKVIYNFPLIRELFSSNSVYLITMRHPLSIIQSTLDKSGGMPENRKFALRSAIERWALDDNLHWGIPEAKVRQMNYVDVFLGYWRRFHIQLAVTGLPALNTARIVPYGKEYMTGTVSDLYRQFGVQIEPEEFKVAPKPKFPKNEEDAAEKTLEEVNNAWAALGLKLPVDQLSERN
jgi:hypothetical protein